MMNKIRSENKVKIVFLGEKTLIEVTAETFN